MKTMLDKCAVAGDITQAIDRRGAWSCAITVIGGTENTAVKLQSADSAGGEFTDFKTLISADEAEADQYKGFVLDLSGAGNFIKIVGATMATCVLGDCDHDVKKVAIKAGEIPSGADLEDNKEVSITENGTVEITPTSGKDGMKKVTATVNVSGGGAELEDNKEATINVSTYTEPVEVLPSEGKDGMKKATITLSNIPSPSGVSTLYAWSDGVGCIYTTTATPTTESKALYADIQGKSIQQKIIDKVGEGTITIFNDVYTRDNTKDIIL